ncbi:dTMP kinase [Micromonospora sp. WMMC273]|uniref:dTMP kinase n=1 Tax=Micromonospora sp. WMMC273 TaxID=3015157 RepID=UPI0022B68C9D|nr:dTMP kinase [Micromonospora sp. WMMC273]MCZ7473004.1 dTMP kinase [Micromonospora sp. WMMC273]
MTWSNLGFFVAVCGIDGSGKTTQVGFLESKLAERGEVVRTRQPTDLYRQDPVVRTVLDMEQDDESVLPEIGLLAAFDRYRHVREVVKPALRAGKAVVTDRYVYTGFAYMMARGMTVEWLTTIYQYLPAPDLTIFLDVPPELAIERIIMRDGSSKKREELDLDRMRAVRDNFLTHPWGDVNYHVLDGTAPQEEVRAGINKLVDAFDPR